MKTKTLKLRHFPSIASAVSYITAELHTTLQIALDRAEGRIERADYTNADRKLMRARIADVAAVAQGLHHLSDREHATVLAALRLRQRCDLHEYDLMDVVTNGGAVVPLTNPEIDALCERLNCGGQ